MVPDMETDWNELVACSACDLHARLVGERDQARRAMRAAETRFLDAALLVGDGAALVPPAVRRDVTESRMHLRALERVLGDLLATHDPENCRAASACC